MAPSTAIMWFRRDLRLSDNPALVEAAAAADQVVALFVDDPVLRRPAGANRRAFLAGCLAHLHDSIAGHLVVRAGPPATVVADLVVEVGAVGVWCAEDFGPYGMARDAEVERALAAHDVPLHHVGSPYAVPPGTVFNQAGEHFKVFTPYSKGWRTHGWDDPVAKPRDLDWATGLRSDQRPTAPRTTADLPEPGELAAKRRLDAFLRSRVDAYRDQRDRPDLDATSRLSPDLKWGTLHPRQALARLGDGEGERTFANELCWREFYADVLFHRPETARSAFNPAMAAMEVDEGPDADERFDAWCAGRTGYPIVDAGMRQLVGEGWMHNRVRMIVASFLVKDLHLDWTRGARFFMDHLVDGDLASNQHGWQWTAGTGTDAAPYFRVFNPILQGRKFDPDGDYVRRWIPELRAVAGATVHDPLDGPPELFAGAATQYPPPIVDHFAEKDEALARYQRVRGG